MTEVFRKYPEAPAGEKTPPMCVVAHPDAGGPCGRPTVGEVWTLPFCEAHGREAELAYMEERNETVGNKLGSLACAEEEWRDRDEDLLTTLKAAPVPAGVDHKIHETAMRNAYPPDDLEGNMDADTLAFDYGKPEIGPHDWWYEARIMVVRFMRQAAKDVPELLSDLELLRERATVQQLLAERDFNRRWRKLAVK